MRNKAIYLVIGILLVISIILASCAETTTSSTSTSAATATSTTSKSTTSTVTTTQTSATTQSTTTASNWWDKFGKPQYGGKITLAVSSYTENFDVTTFSSGESQMWYDALFEPDWTTDRNEWAFTTDFTPDQYWTGVLAETWEQTDPQTMVIHLRKGMNWQNKAPVNGREFNSDDVVQHFDRILGTGSGYTKANPMLAGSLSNLASVTATDNYTVVFKFKTASSGVAFQTIADTSRIEAPECVKDQGGTITDWTKAIGTGPWILTNYVSNSSLTYGGNSAYIINDPRYPQNHIPYVDELTLLVIPDTSTQQAALRTGKIDFLNGITWQYAKTLQSSNKDLQQMKLPGGGGAAAIQTSYGVAFRLDKTPFTDIKVRKALQMSINLKEIAEGYYGGSSLATPSGLVTQNYAGYAYDYNNWSQSLKDEYAYNPAAAKQLLSDAGYPDGFKTTLVAGTSDDLQLLQIFKAYFLNIGVDMEINAMDPNAAFGLMITGKVDQMFTGAGGFTSRPTRTIEEFYSAGSNFYKVNDANYDAIRNKFWASTNANEVASTMIEADKYVIEQHWLILGPETNSYAMWQSYFKGYSGEALGFNQKYVCSRLWIDQTK